MCCFSCFCSRGTLFLPRVRCSGYCGVYHPADCFAAYECGTAAAECRELMNNIEVDGGGDPSGGDTLAPLPTAVALATTGEIVWANDAFAEISGRGTAVSGVRMGEIAPTFEDQLAHQGTDRVPGRAWHRQAAVPCIRQSGAERRGTADDAILSTAPSLSVCATRLETTVRLSRLSRSTTYEDLVKHTTDSGKIQRHILAGIDKRLFAWVKGLKRRTAQVRPRQVYLRDRKRRGWTSWSRCASPFCRRCARLRTTRAL